jgi:hypothetical protein
MRIRFHYTIDELNQDFSILPFINVHNDPFCRSFCIGWFMFTCVIVHFKQNDDYDIIEQRDDL